MADVALRIPTSHEAAIVMLLDIEEEELSRVIAILSARAGVPIQGLTEEVQRQTKLSTADVELFLSLLVSMYSLRERLGPGFVARLRSAFNRADHPRLRGISNEQWERMEARLNRLLSLEALALTTKALDVRTEHERVYCSSRVLTDLRPVFGDDPSASPRAMATIHTLKLEYHQPGQHGEFYLALNARDVQDLIEVLQRAITKERTLRAIYHRNDVSWIED